MATRIQLCGTLTAEVDGRRVEQELPGRQGRLLLAYLCLHRLRVVPRDELVEALWPEGADAGLAPLLSKLRRLVPLEGRGDVRLALPRDAWIDVEAAADALHRAEAAAARGDWHGVWGPARVAQHVGARPFLPGDDLPWVVERRRRLEERYAAGLELVARACLAIGGSEVATAERAARSLVAAEPFRESGHRLLMEALRDRDDRAGALHVYERLRVLLRDELGVPPSAVTQELHRALLE